MKNQQTLQLKVNGHSAENAPGPERGLPGPRECATLEDADKAVRAPNGKPDGNLRPPNGKSDLWSAAGSLLALQNRSPRLRRLPAGQAAPLSFAQERLWMLEQSEPGAPYYNVPLTWEITGALNVGALERSLQKVVERHEVLRTTFPETPDGPRQQIKDWQPQLEHVDLSHLLPNERRAEAKRLGSRLARAPFDLVNGPLFRAALYQLEQQRFQLLMVVHQTVFDGASVRVVSLEMGECYRAFCAGCEPALPRLRIRYADFSAWQRQCLTGEVLAAAEEFWAAQFRKRYEPLRFTTDHPRRNSGITPGASVPLTLERELTDELRRLSLEAGVTPFAALLGCFQAFLSQCTGQEDVLTLASIAARNQSELRDVVGLLANVLPLRLDLSGKPTLMQVLERAGQSVSAALPHQTLPLSRILEKLPSSGTNADVTVLQTLIIYNNTPFPTIELPGVVFTPSFEFSNGTAKFDFLLDVADSSHGLCGHLKYRSDLFEPATVLRFIEDWKGFIQWAVAHPTAPLASHQLRLVFSHGTATAKAAAPALQPTPAPEPLVSALPERNGHAAAVQPRTELERTLAVIWEQTFDVRPIGIHDNFFGLGGHSLIAVKLIAAIEKEIGKKLRLRTIFQEPTIARLAEALAGTENARHSSVIEIQPRGSKPPLFLVHGVGGGMFWGYSNLAHHLGLDQPVYAFKSRGMDGLEEFERIEDMAAQYVSELRQFQPRGPYYLGGYCFGGNVAFEMARQLRAQHQEVALLLLMNCWPNNSSYTKLTLHPAVLAQAVSNFCYRLGHQFRWAVKQPRDFFKWRTAWLRKRVKSFFTGNLEDRVAVEDIVDLSTRPEHERKLWRTHVQAWLQYQPQPYDGRIVLFRTRGHPLACSFDHRMGWGPFARGGVTVKICPGDHESLLETENAAETARQLRLMLDELATPKDTPPLARTDAAPSKRDLFQVVTETAVASQTALVGK
jgi:thioesterase domain-containing protein/acyl carrier protein